MEFTNFSALSHACSKCEECLLALSSSTPRYFTTSLVAISPPPTSRLKTLGTRFPVSRITSVFSRASRRPVSVHQSVTSLTNPRTLTPISCDYRIVRILAHCPTATFLANLMRMRPALVFLIPVAPTIVFLTVIILRYTSIQSRTSSTLIRIALFLFLATDALPPPSPFPFPFP